MLYSGEMFNLLRYLRTMIWKIINMFSIDSKNQFEDVYEAKFFLFGCQNIHDNEQSKEKVMLINSSMISDIRNIFECIQTSP